MADGANTIDVERVRHLARLARLKLTDDELRQHAAGLGAILEAFRDIEQVDTSNVTPLPLPRGSASAGREDVAHTPLSHARALANGPDTRDGLFLVPRIFQRSQND